MKKLWQNHSGRYESSAKIVDGNLILSLPDAINPVVWRMELGSVKSSALEVRANDNIYLLTLKTPRGDVHDIAPYETRERAVYALMQVSEALENGEGKIAPLTATPQPTLAGAEKSYAPAAKWLVAFSAVILLIFLFSYSSSKSPSPEVLQQNEPAAASSTAPGESGVPQSADDYLRGF